MKCLHIMTLNSGVVNPVFVEYINTFFTSTDHEFIYLHKESYELSKKFPNTQLCENFMSGKLKTFKKYQMDFDYIFFHSLDKDKIIYLNKKICKKIIWCVWGGDLYSIDLFEIDPQWNLYKKFKRIIIRLFLILQLERVFLRIRTTNSRIKSFHSIMTGFTYDWRAFLRTTNSRIKSFHSIMTGFTQDSVEIRRLYGNKIKIVDAYYLPDAINVKILNKIKDSAFKLTDNINNNPIKIMIGNRASDFLNHEHWLRELAKYKQENIIISLVLNHSGSKEYIDKIEKMAIEIFGKKIEILKNILPIEDYCAYLASVDICIIDCKRQAAVGNILMLLYYGKKVFLNPDGVLYKGLITECEIFKTTDIYTMEYGEFIDKNYDGSRGIRYVNWFVDEERIKKNWESFFDILENNLKNNSNS